MRKLYLILSMTLFSVLMFLPSRDRKQEAIYSDFRIKIKKGEYLEGYKILYDLSKKNDIGAIKLISRAYLGDYGIDMDMIKSNIWREKGEICLYCEAGFNEFEQYKVFLINKDYGMASVFLQRAAEKGSEKAIDILKNSEFISKNNLNIDKNWKKYWEDFDYDNLYPFCQEIEECKKDVLIRKTTRVNLLED